MREKRVMGDKKIFLVSRKRKKMTVKMNEV